MAPPTPIQLPGVIFAALATLVFGAVLGPEMPLIALAGGLAVLATRPPGGAGAGRWRAGRRRKLGDHRHAAALALTGAFLLMEATGLAGPMLGWCCCRGCWRRESARLSSSAWTT